MLNTINMKLATLQASAHVSGAQKAVRCVSQNAPQSYCMLYTINDIPYTLYYILRSGILCWLFLFLAGLRKMINLVSAAAGSFVSKRAACTIYHIPWPIYYKLYTIC
jgi:hypothetical protein